MNKDKMKKQYQKPEQVFVNLEPSVMMIGSNQGGQAGVGGDSDPGGFDGVSTIRRGSWADEWYEW